MLRVQGNPIFIVVLLGSLIVVLLGGLIVVLLGGLLVGLVVVLVVGLQGDLLFGVISIFARLFLGGIQVFVFNVVAGLSKEVGVGRVLEVRSVVEALIVVYRGGDAAVPPVVVAEQESERHEGRADHRQLAELDADVEADELGDEVIRAEAEVLQDRCEAEAVKEAKAEDDSGPPRVEFPHENVFHTDIEDGGGNERLDDA